jgi:hypothetical protein
MANAAPGEVQYEPISLAGKYDILPDMPLPALNGPGGPAYAVRGIRERRMELFALVCNAGVPPRMEILSAMRGVEHPAMMRLLDFGVVDWTPDGSRRLVLILEKPGGKQLMPSLADTRDPMPEDQLTRLVLLPLCSALKETSSRGIVHGDVRPTNLFIRENGGNALMLGECVSGLPSYTQPIMMLTIERAMAQPGGRGSGTVADDLYALGVTALILLLGRNPVKQLDDDQVLQAKVDRGSYPALAGSSRVSISLMEPLRGLLSDDPKQRWTLNDLDLWLSGRRLSPKQPQVPRKAARPFEFGGTDHWHCRALARAFARNPSAAAPMIDAGELDRWLRRSLGDDARAEVVGNAITTAAAAGRAGSHEERLVGRVGMALDPAAPIRYKQKSVMVDGLGGALADAMIRGESPQALAEIIAAQLPMFWVNVQPEFRPEHVPIVQSYDAQRSILERPGSGFGIERVLYELNPMLPCISQMLRGQFVMTPHDLLQALDQVATHSDRSREPLDRHIAAFLAARCRKLDERLLGLTAGAEPVRRVSAILHILSDAQRRYGPAELPHLCAWMVELIEPAFERFHNRTQRSRLKAEAEKAAHDGDLTVIMKLIDDPKAIRKDESGFAAAQVTYQKINVEVEQLHREIAGRAEMSETLGRQVAAVVSSVLATALLVVIVLLTLTRA